LITDTVCFCLRLGELDLGVRCRLFLGAIGGNYPSHAADGHYCAASWPLLLLLQSEPGSFATSRMILGLSEKVDIDIRNIF
jgi:hypothetical protein